MATVKVFDSKGCKTLKMLGNANEQDYDPVEVPEFVVDTDTDTDTDTDE